MPQLESIIKDNHLLAFFQMQGFGDLVILANILKKYAITNKNYNIIMGSYLLERIRPRY